MSWLVLAFIAPIIWSVVVLIDDNLVRSVYKSPYTGAIISGFFGLVPLVSLLWIEMDTISLQLQLIAVASGFLTVLYYFFYFQALQREAPSVVIALFSLSPATLPFLAHYFLGENLSSQQFLGFLIVLTFTFFLAAIDVRKFRFSAAIIPILAAVVFWDLGLLAGKYVYDQTSFYTGFMHFSLGMGLAALFFCYVRMFDRRIHHKKKPKRMKKRYLMITVVLLSLTELLNIAAEFTSNLAISKGPVSLVQVIQNTQPMYLLLIALALYPFYPKQFREAGQGRIGFKLLMMTGIIAGVAFTFL